METCSSPSLRQRAVSVAIVGGLASACAVNRKLDDLEAESSGGDAKLQELVGVARKVAMRRPTHAAASPRDAVVTARAAHVAAGGARWTRDRRRGKRRRARGETDVDDDDEDSVPARWLGSLYHGAAGTSAFSP